MQQAIPYKSWVPLYTNNKLPLNITPLQSPPPSNVSEEIVGSERKMSRLVSENPIIVFARRGCCMSHVVKRLLLGLGVNPAVYEIDDEKDEAGVLRELVTKSDFDDKKLQFPAVFIGGKLFGGLDRVMATHISGELIPVLKEARALWL